MIKKNIVKTKNENKVEIVDSFLSSLTPSQQTIWNWAACVLKYSYQILAADVIFGYYWQLPTIGFHQMSLTMQIYLDRSVNEKKL